MTALYAVPGQPALYEGPPPTGAAERAVAALTDLSARIDALEIFGFLRPPVVAARVEHDALGGRGPEPVVKATFRGDALTERPTTPYVITWRWRVLRERDDWFDLGWHPSEMFLALSADGQRLVQEAVNGPYIGHWAPARRTPHERGRDARR